MAFTDLKVNYNKWINLISSATFGVYLIHDHCIIRPWLWKTVFHNVTFQNSVLIIPYSLAVVIIVYVSCTIFDLLRRVSIERIYMRFLNWNIEQLSLPFQEIRNNLQSTLFGD